MVPHYGVVNRTKFCIDCSDTQYKYRNFKLYMMKFG